MSVTRLVQFWTAEEATWQGLLERARADLEGARAAREAARASLARAATGQVAKQAEIAAMKARLAADRTPADADAHARELRSLVVEWHAQAGAGVQAAQELARAEAVAARASVQATRMAEALSRATASKGAAQAREDERARIEAALAAPPLLGIEAAAAAATTGPEQVAALARLSDAFPAALLGLLERRRQIAVGQQARLEAAAADTELLLATHLATVGLPGAVDGLSPDHEKAWSALTAHARAAPDEFARALGLLASVGSAAKPTDDERTDAASGPFQADGASAIAVEDQRDAALDAWDAAAAALAKATCAARAPDPTADVSGTVAGLATACANALTDLGGKEAAFSGGAPSEKRKLDLWEASLPDGEYALAAAYGEAIDALTRLGAVVPADLASRCDDAEQALVDALVAEAKASRSTQFLRDAAAEQADLAARLRTLSRDTIASSVRGDR